MLATFEQDGILTARLAAEDIQVISSALRDTVSGLSHRRVRQSERTFEGNQAWLSAATSPGTFDLIRSTLSRAGLISVASGYLGRDVDVRHVLIQINDVSDQFLRDVFAGTGVRDPQTNYMHIDTTDEVLKCVVYLGQVEDTTGPFSYVRGSARLPVGWWEAVIRRANDRSGLSAFDAASRQQFNALPRFLQRKCTFGSDLLDGSVEAQQLLEAEYFFTSRDGDVALFDNLGVHRGARVEEGERCALFVMLA